MSDHSETDGQPRSTAEIVGREDVNDLVAIMSVVNEDWDEEIHAERCGLVVEEALDFCYLLP